MTLPKWLYLVQILAPAILNSYGVPAELTGAISDGIQEAEAIPGASGTDKKAHVLGIVGDAITAVNNAKGKQLLDPIRVPTLAGSAIDLVVETVDLVHDRTTEPNQLNTPAPSNVEPAIPSATTQAAQAASAQATSAPATSPALPPPTELPPAAPRVRAKGPSKTATS